jgi:hypothetical protein
VSISFTFCSFEMLYLWKRNGDTSPVGAFHPSRPHIPITVSTFNPNRAIFRHSA